MTAPLGAPGSAAGWVDVAGRTITQVGFPVVVAGLLLWFLLTRFQEGLQAITARMAANTEAAGRLVEAERGQLVESQRQTEELERQTQYLSDQGRIMAEIAKDAQTLVDIRTQEVTLLKQLEAKKP